MLLLRTSALGLVLLGTSLGAAAEPWVISDDVVITQPADVGDVVVIGDGSLTVLDVPEPGLRITGNLVALGDSRVALQDSVIKFMSVHHGQYALIGADHARVEVKGCNYRVPNGVQHGLVAAGDAEMRIEDSDFDDVQFLAAQSARLDAARLNGSFEVIVMDAAAMSLADIPRDGGQGRLWVWVEFGADSVAEYSPPLPGLVDHWSFPPAGAGGIPQSVELDRCQVLLWPLLVRPGSDLTLSHIAADNWVVVGLHLPSDATISGLVNGTLYEDTELGLSDRRLRLLDAAVDTWNLYPEEAARVVVRDSVVGEILSAGRSDVRVQRTTVDGSGGFFGARDHSRITTSESTITCTVEASQDATIELHWSTAEPYPTDPDVTFTRFGAYDRGRLLADHTPVTSTPAAAGQGLIAVAYIINPPPAPPADGSPVVLEGSVGMWSLDPALAPGSWRLEAVPRLGGIPTVIATGTANVEEGVLGEWGGADPLVDHLLQLTLTDGWGRRLVAGRWVPGTGPRLRAAPDRP